MWASRKARAAPFPHRSPAHGGNRCYTARALRAWPVFFFLVASNPLSALGADATDGANQRGAPLTGSTLRYELDATARSCPTEREFREVIAERMGHDPFARPGDGRVHVRFTRRGSAWIATVALTNRQTPAEPRELRSVSSHCRELFASVAFMVGVFLEARSQPREEAQQATLDESPQATRYALDPVEPPEHRPERAVQRVEGASLRARLGFGTFASVGATSQPATGLFGFIGVGRRSFSVDLESRATLPVTTREPGGGGVRSSFLLAGVIPCGRTGPFSACPVGVMGIFRGEGQDVGTPDRADTFYAAVGARVGMEQPLTRWLSIRLHGEMLTVLTPTTLYARGLPLWSTPPFHGNVGLSVLTLL